MKNNLEYIFVYGTLKRGYSNNILLRNSETAQFVSEATIKGDKYKMISLGSFPGVIPVEKNGTNIHGEIWTVSDEETKQRLDNLEGYKKHDPLSSLYLKEQVEIDNKLCTIYIFNYKKYNHNSFTIENNLVKNGNW